MTPPAALHPSTLVPCPVSNQTPSDVPEQPTTQPRAPRGIMSRWTLPAELLLSPYIFLSTCIIECLGTGETLPVLDNGSIMCLSWSLCGSCSIECHKNRDRGANRHLYVTDCHQALEFQHWRYQARAATAALPQKQFLPALPPPTYQAPPAP